MRQFVNKNLYFILLLFCILPYNYSSLVLNSFSSLVNIGVYLIRFLLILYVASYMKNLKLTKYENKIFKEITFYFISIFAINVLSTLSSNSFEMSSLIIRSFSMVYMYGFFVYMIYNYKNMENFNKKLISVTSVLLLFSIVLYLFFPSIGRMYEGYNSYALLGVAANRNSYFELIFPAVVSILFLNDSRKLQKKEYIFIILTIITVFLSRSVTSIIALVIFWAFVFVKKMKWNISKVLKTSLITSIILWICFFGIIVTNTSLSSISSMFSNKSTTLSGRTIIWEKALYFIKQKPLIGYGYDNTIIGDPYIYPYQGNEVFPNDTHNSALFILLASGILGFILLFWFIVDGLKKGSIIVKYDAKYYYLMAYLIANLIRGLTESSLHYPHMIIFLYLIFIKIRYNELIMKKGEKENE